MKDYVITIGRRFGSGGGELGRLLAERLGIPFYDKELLYQAARNAGVSAEFYKNSDERVPRFFNGMIPFSHGVNPIPWYSNPSLISDDGLYQSQSDFISKIAAEGPCVIVGRSADYILRDHPGLVSVFVHADTADCVKRILQRNECADELSARRMAERVNKLRANYYNFYTDKRWGDSGSYDLCFNSSRLTIPQIADLIISYINNRV